MAENGEEKLRATARHIAETLGANDTMTNNILQIYSNFDCRLSRDKLSVKLVDEDPRGCASLDRTLNASHNPVGVCPARADDLMQQAMFCLEDEFRSLMERGAESFELSRNNPDSTGNLSSDSEDENGENHEELLGNGGDPNRHNLIDYGVVIKEIPSGTVNDMHEMAQRMVAAGFGKECSRVYSKRRREFLEECISTLGLQKLSIEEVQKMAEEDIDDEIQRWIKATKVALYILFPRERRLCDRVFKGFYSDVELSFMDVCGGSANRLLNFADAIAFVSRSPETLFKVLYVFETLRDLMPAFDYVFRGQDCLVLRNEVVDVWKRLGEAIRGIFMELENLIQQDPGKAAVPGGGLHPITRYVLNYLGAACRSWETLEQVFNESNGVVPSNKVDDKGSSSSLISVRIGRIMELLESNLEVKSTFYKDNALCSVFMMNNCRYIVQKVMDSDLKSLMADDWIRKLNAKVRQYSTHYLRSSWTKILESLKLDNSSLASNAIAKSMKEKIKSFNSQFEEVCKTQSTWAVFDDQLKEELRISVSRLLLPAYTNFIGRLQCLPEIGKNANRLIRYSPEDIEARVSELFEGRNGSSNGRK
ncbi:hypothetical protein PTKIN_Ptkin03bG0005400 [Pterospermum kingtungense]